MPDVLVATDTKFKALYDLGPYTSFQLTMRGTGLTYTSSGDPAVLLPTGGDAKNFTLKIFYVDAETLELAYTRAFKVSQLSIVDIADITTAGIDFSTAIGIIGIFDVLAGSKIKIVEGAGVFNGTDASDLVYGNSENNEIYGNGGDDVIYGAGGNDEINSQSGADTLFGGKGHDYILVSREDPNPKTVWAYGGDGRDSFSSSDVYSHFYGGNGDDAFVGQRSYTDSSSEATFYGGKGNDWFGIGGITEAYGGRGNDTFQGGFGLLAKSHLKGGNGADTFYMGRHDVVKGGGGADLFIFSLAFEIDKAVVKDFDLSMDHIRMLDTGLTTAAAAFAEFGAHASDVGAGVKYVSEDGSDTIILKGVSLADLTVDHFI